jgi:hypothetical protein
MINFHEFWTLLENIVVPNIDIRQQRKIREKLAQQRVEINPEAFIVPNGRGGFTIAGPDVPGIKDAVERNDVRGAIEIVRNQMAALLKTGHRQIQTGRSQIWDLKARLGEIAPSPNVSQAINKMDASQLNALINQLNTLPPDKKSQLTSAWTIAAQQKLNQLQKAA